MHFSLQCLGNSRSPLRFTAYTDESFIALLFVATEANVVCHAGTGVKRDRKVGPHAVVQCGTNRNLVLHDHR